MLDARDPLACRCTDVERYIRQTNPDKKIILLLNKMGEPYVARSASGGADDDGCAWVNDDSCWGRNRRSCWGVCATRAAHGA